MVNKINLNDIFDTAQSPADKPQPGLSGDKFHQTLIVISSVLEEAKNRNLISEYKINPRVNLAQKILITGVEGDKRMARQNGKIVPRSAMGDLWLILYANPIHKPLLSVSFHESGRSRWSSVNHAKANLEQNDAVHFDPSNAEQCGRLAASIASTMVFFQKECLFQATQPQVSDKPTSKPVP